ncbi:hypothetical protein [Stieleria neptunia]|uniref:hypothetical protein n=1 Tax=Stieleria neptunia TaxID=2527979 RepID=UPI0018D27105|nr:hypothetical protein [Stieleria neptunia]
MRTRTFDATFDFLFGERCLANITHTDSAAFLPTAAEIPIRPQAETCAPHRPTGRLWN